MEKLEAGKFEDKLIQSVMSARNFVLVLSAGALDKCMQDHDCKDWVHKVGTGLCTQTWPVAQRTRSTSHSFLLAKFSNLCDIAGSQGSLL